MTHVTATGDRVSKDYRRFDSQRCRQARAAQQDEYLPYRRTAIPAWRLRPSHGQTFRYTSKGRVADDMSGIEIDRQLVPKTLALYNFAKRPSDRSFLPPSPGRAQRAKQIERTYAVFEAFGKCLLNALPLRIRFVGNSRICPAGHGHIGFGGCHHDD